MARLPCTISLMRRGGTPSARARPFCVSPIGFMNSSIRISPGWGLWSKARLAVIIDDFDIPRSSGGPNEAYSPLIVYPNAVLPRPIAFERFETISGRHAQIVQLSRLIEQTELAQRHVLDIRRQMPAPLTTPYSRGLRIAEADDHSPITYNVMAPCANPSLEGGLPFRRSCRPAWRR